MISLLTMETAVIGAVCFLYTTFRSVNGLQFNEFPVKELASFAEMYHFTDLLRNTREAAGFEEEQQQFHRHRHMFPDYKHCCGGYRSRNQTAGTGRWKILKSCVGKVNTNLREEYDDANGINDPFSCERMKELKNRYYCTADCVMKEAGELMDDGTVNNEKFKKYITKDISAGWLKEIAENAVDKCTEEKENNFMNTEKLKCNPRAVILKHCVWKEVLQTCPEEHLKKSEYCSRVKKAFQEMEGGVKTKYDDNPQ